MPELIVNRKCLTVWCRDDCHARCQLERGRPGLAKGPGGVVFACPCACHQDSQLTELVALNDQRVVNDGPL